MQFYEIRLDLSSVHCTLCTLTSSVQGNPLFICALVSRICCQIYGVINTWTLTLGLVFSLIMSEIEYPILRLRGILHSFFD